jgi:DNA polymerase III epsilon subunit-like protein
MNKIMIDIETMGTGPLGAIVSIGAVVIGTNNEFYRNVNLSSSIALGMNVDSDTVVWWSKQSDDARNALARPEPVPLRTALESLHSWIPEGKKQVWANGASFDLVILRNAYQLIGLNCPWSFREEMCMRSIRSVGDEIGFPYKQYKQDNVIVAHNALDDARVQAAYLTELLNIVLCGCKRETP